MTPEQTPSQQAGNPVQNQPAPTPDQDEQPPKPEVGHFEKNRKKLGVVLKKSFKKK